MDIVSQHRTTVVTGPSNIWAAKVIGDGIPRMYGTTLEILEIQSVINSYSLWCRSTINSRYSTAVPMGSTGRGIIGPFNLNIILIHFSRKVSSGFYREHCLANGFVGRQNGLNPFQVTIESNRGGVR